jgi:hypothetical protein
MAFNNMGALNFTNEQIKMFAELSEASKDPKKMQQLKNQFEEKENARRDIERIFGNQADNAKMFDFGNIEKTIAQQKNGANLDAMFRNDIAKNIAKNIDQQKKLPQPKATKPASFKIVNKSGRKISVDGNFIQHGQSITRPVGIQGLEEVRIRAAPGQNPPFNIVFNSKNVKNGDVYHFNNNLKMREQKSVSRFGNSVSDFLFKGWRKWVFILVILAILGGGGYFIYKRKHGFGKRRRR